MLEKVWYLGDHSCLILHTGESGIQLYLSTIVKQEYLVWAITILYKSLFLDMFSYHWFGKWQAVVLG